MAGPNDLLPEPQNAGGLGGPRTGGVSPGVDYRRIQLQTAMIQPWHIPESGAAREADALSQALKDFSTKASDIGDIVGKKEGVAAGAAAGVTPGFTPKTGLAAMTSFGESYNAAAHVTYVNQTQSVIEDAINGAEQANPRDPAAFQAQVQAIKQKTLEQTPNLYAPEVSNMFDRRIAAGNNRIAEQTIRGTQEDALASYTTTLKSRMTTAVRTAGDLPAADATATIQQAVHDNKTQLDALVASHTISQARADTLQEDATNTITEMVHEHHATNVASNFLEVARKGDITASDKMMADYMNDPANSKEDRMAVTRQYEEQREQFVHFQGQLHAKDISNLASYIEQAPGQKEGRGGFGPQVLDQIDSMHKQGWITDEYARSLSDRVALNSEKGRADDTDTYNVDSVMHGTAPKFDPKDPKAGKAVDTYFKTVAQANNAPRGSDAYNQLAVSVMQRTSIVPPVIQKGVIADLNSGDPDRAAAASRLAEQLRTANPTADLYQTDSKSAAFQHILERNLEAGMPNATAYSMAREQTEPSPEIIKARTANYSADVRATNEKNPAQANNAVLNSKLAEAFNAHWYNSNVPAPVPNVNMQVEFGDLTKEFYSRTGNLSQAQDLAYQQLQKTWKYTTVNGKPELMKFGPDPQEVPLIREGIAKVVKALNLPDDPGTITLSAFGNTNASQGTQWNLHHANGDPVLDGNNNPVTFSTGNTRPQYQARLAQQKAAQDAADAAAKASAVQHGAQMAALHEKLKNIAAANAAMRPDFAGMR